MNDTYLPTIVKVSHIVKETPDIKTFYLKHSLNFVPGQFLEVSYFGLGEAPISISSSPDEKFLKLSFRQMGCVTKGLFGLGEKDSIGIRGPFGNGFPIDEAGSKDLILIGGGIGAAPLRSLLKFLISRKGKTGSITLLYGARTPRDLLYKEELKGWAESINPAPARRGGVKVLLTVDRPDSKWKGRIGVVTQLLNEIQFDPSEAKAFICGPEIMMRFTTQKLIRLGMPLSDINVSLERYMKCGVGKCGHCYIADKFVCRDGPVFTYAQLNSLTPAEIL